MKVIELEKKHFANDKSSKKTGREKEAKRLTIVEAGKMIGYSHSTIRRWINRAYDPLPAEFATPTKSGRSEGIRIPLDEFLKWTERNIRKNYG